MEVPHFGRLATPIMRGSLTSAQVIETLRALGQEIPPDELTAVGIRYDLGKRTLALLLWLALPSTPPHPASSATASHTGAGPVPLIPSRSKGRRS